MVYIIAEAGQNHQGDMIIAKQLIDMAAMQIKHDDKYLKGVDAVKFTKRDLNSELSIDEKNRPYNDIHSFGQTYGQHRQFLELSYDQHYELYEYAKVKGLDFIETICSIPALYGIMALFNPDKIKIASRDVDNIPLLIECAKTGIPIILSSGMSDFQDIQTAIFNISKYNKNISILHCVSEYPTSYNHLNLKSIEYLKQKLKNFEVGFSDHTTGVLAGALSICFGAKIVEKHITLDRNMKGRDHAGAMDKEGLYRFVRDIRNSEIAIGGLKKEITEGSKINKQKLGRSWASSRDIPQGKFITQDDLELLSPAEGFNFFEAYKIIGCQARQNIRAKTIIKQEMI